MAVFQMQLQRLHASVDTELDRSVRRCVWGGKEGKKKIHLVNWEVLYKPKERGGVGLKKAEAMNKALLAK